MYMQKEGNRPTLLQTATPSVVLHMRQSFTFNSCWLFDMPHTIHASLSCYTQLLVIVPGQKGSFLSPLCDNEKLGASAHTT